MSILMIVVLTIVWFAFGIYTTYRTLIYGFFSTKQVLSGGDMFTLFIMFPLCGFLTFIGSLAFGGPRFAFGWNVKRREFKNPFYNPKKDITELF